MMELFWTPEATQDRDEIYDYIEADNPAAALALDELFAEKAGRLVDHPGLGRPGRVAGTRELVAHQNYILVYDVATAWQRAAHAARAPSRRPRHRPDDRCLRPRPRPCRHVPGHAVGALGLCSDLPSCPGRPGIGRHMGVQMIRRPSSVNKRQ